MMRIRSRARGIVRRIRADADARTLQREVAVEIEAAGRRTGDAAVPVAVLHPGEHVPAWVAGLAGAVVTAVPAGLDEDERHLRLAAAAPFEVVVDTVPGAPGRLRRFLDSFYLLRADGGYVVRGGAVELESSRDGLGAMLARAAASRSEPAPVPGPGVDLRLIDDHALGRAAVDWRASGPHLVVRNGLGDSLAKLRETDLPRLTALRPDLPVRVLREIPAESFRSAASFHEIGTPVRMPPTAYDAPQVSLREYDGPVVLPGQIVQLDRVLLPDTYRHWMQRRLRNRHLEEQALRFARLHDHPEPVHLPGRYFHLDNEERGHYGHVMTESISRVWAWEQCKAADPDLKVLLGTNRRREIQPYEYEIYAAAGIARDDLVLIDGPVRVDQLVSAAPLFSNPEFVHPHIRETWRTIGDNLAARAEGGPRPERFFCSRRIAKRACRNTPEVEELFREHGFEVVFPEDFSLGDQVELFRSASVVAGFAGSGLFNLCFVERPVQVISLRSESYTATNEYLMAALHGHSFQSVVSRAENPKKFQSPWSVDLEREGRELAEFLAALPG